ncbi:MAG: hypothetical protein KKE17_08825 [Proteobacteria bacterium]|nr:hypothetical protein [Pseudomonadota bacterium]MBU1710091.1 hypothetical protein [Pseudomonadota bacterium]
MTASNDITNELITIITEMASQSGQPVHNITADTYLGGDLQLRSLDFIRLVGAINQHFGRHDIPFQELFIAEDGSILEDIQVRYVADFLSRHL